VIARAMVGMPSAYADKDGRREPGERTPRGMMHRKRWVERDGQGAPSNETPAEQGKHGWLKSGGGGNGYGGLAAQELEDRKARTGGWSGTR
jgi:hypothetical protein